MHQQLPSLTFTDLYIIPVAFRWHQASTSAQCFHPLKWMGPTCEGACPSRNTVWLQSLTRTNIPQVDSLNSTDELILVYVSFILRVFFPTQGYSSFFYYFYWLHPLFPHISRFSAYLWVGSNFFGSKNWGWQKKHKSPIRWLTEV